MCQRRLPDRQVAAQRPPADVLERIRALRRHVRLSAPSLDGRCGAVSDAITSELGLARRWGHRLLLDGSVCWLHCWNELADGSILDATADQFEELFPGDILVLAPSEPLAQHYLASPPGREFHIAADEGIRLRLFVDAREESSWPDNGVGWEELASAVLGAMPPWQQPQVVAMFLGNYLRTNHLLRFKKRDIEGPIDEWAWARRQERRGGRWVPRTWTLATSSRKSRFRRSL